MTRLSLLKTGLDRPLRSAVFAVLLFLLNACNPLASTPVTQDAFAPGQIVAIPSAPLDLVATLSGANIGLVWKAPETGSAPLTYTILKSSTSGTGFVEIKTGYEFLTYTDKDAATPAATVFYTVYATNIFGQSDDAVESVVAFDIPFTVSEPSSVLTTAGPVTYTLTYSNASAVTLAPADVTLNATGDATCAIDVTTESALVRTVTLSTCTGTGTLGISIAADSAADAAGNLALASAPSSTFAIDNTAPTVTAVAVIDGLNVDVTFSEEMIADGVTTAANYTISAAGMGSLAAHPTSVAVSPSLTPNTYRLTWATGEMLGGGDVTITVASTLGHVVTDVALNPIAADATAVGTDPTGGIGDAPTITTVAVVDGLNVDVTFSEAMTVDGGLADTAADYAANYTLSGTGMGSLAATPTGVAATLVPNTYRLTWATGEMVNGGAIRITVANAQDSSANPVAGGTYGEDADGAIGVAPQVTAVDIVDGSNIDVTFDEEMTVDGGLADTAADFAANYTLSDTGMGSLAATPTSVTRQGLTNVYRLNWTTGEMLDGAAILITVAAATDAAGNVVDSGANSGADSPAIGVLPTVTGLVDDAVSTKIKTWTWGCSETCTYRYAIDTSATWVAAGAYGATVTASQITGDGTYYIHVQAKDTAGNESAIVDVSAVLDNTAPALPSAVSLVTPATSPGNVTTPTIQIGGLVSGDSIGLYKTSCIPANLVGIGTAAAATLNLTVSGALADASYTFYAQSTDSAGNASGCSTANVVYLLNTVLPTVTLLSNDAVPTPSKTWNWGCSAASCTYRYIIDTAALTAPAGAYGATITDSQATGDGTYYIHVQAKDDAGNESVVVHAAAVLDNTGPTVSSVVVQTGRTVDVTFDSTMGVGVTTAANYTLSGLGKGSLNAIPDSVAVSPSGVPNAYRLTWLAGEMVKDQDITITVAAVEDDLGNLIAGGNVGTHLLGGIGVLPKVSTVSVFDGSNIDVTFDEVMLSTGVATAADWPANYTASGAGKGSLNANPDSVARQGVTNVYRLHWNAGKMTTGAAVTITVADATDLAGNVVDGTANSKSGTGIGAAATVVDVTTSEVSGTYIKDDTVDVEVNFSEAVTVDTTDGVPYLKINTGTVSTSREAYLTAGSGTATLVFTYTVADTDYSTNLDYVDAASLVLDGGTIQDSVGNDATLTLAIAGTANSLKGTSDAVPKIILVNSASVSTSTVSTVTAVVPGTCASAATCKKTETITLKFTSKSSAGLQMGLGGLDVVFSTSAGAGESTGTLSNAGVATDVGDGTYTATFTATGKGTPVTISATMQTLPVTSTKTVRVINTSTPVATASLVNTTHVAQNATGLFAGTDADGDSLTYMVVAAPSHGNITSDGTSAPIYEPDAGFIGADSFTFKAYDGTVFSNTAAVSILVGDHIVYLQTALNGGDDLLDSIDDPTKPFENAQAALVKAIAAEGADPGTKILIAMGAGSFGNIITAIPNYIGWTGAGTATSTVGTITTTGSAGIPDAPAGQPGTDGGEVFLISDNTVTFGAMNTSGGAGGDDTNGCLVTDTGGHGGAAGNVTISDAVVGNITAIGGAAGCGTGTGGNGGTIVITNSAVGNVDSSGGAASLGAGGHGGDGGNVDTWPTTTYGGQTTLRGASGNGDGLDGVWVDN